MQQQKKQKIYDTILLKLIGGDSITIPYCPDMTMLEWMIKIAPIIRSNLKIDIIDGNDFTYKLIQNGKGCNYRSQRFIRVSELINPEKPIFSICWKCDGYETQFHYKGNLNKSNCVISTDCSICLDTVHYGDIVMFDCLHVHHKSCVDKMKQNNDQIICPICRKVIIEY